MFPRRCPRRGAHRCSRTWSVMQTAVPLPRLPSVAPNRKSRTRQAARQLAGIQQTNGFTIRLTRFIAGEPPDPVPLGRKLQASGRRSSASSLRPTLPPIAGMLAAETPVMPAPVSRSLRIACHGDAFSGRTTAATIDAAGPDPGETPETGPFRSKAQKSKP